MTIYKLVLRIVIAYGLESWTLRHVEESPGKKGVESDLMDQCDEIEFGGAEKNAELRELYGEADVGSVVKQARLRWVG